MPVAEDTEAHVGQAESLRCLDGEDRDGAAAALQLVDDVEQGRVHRLGDGFETVEAVPQ